MTLNPSLLRKSLLLSIAATASLATIPTVQAADLQRLAAGDYTESADGKLLLNAEPIRLSHAPERVASACVTVDSRVGLRGQHHTKLVNTCDYSVKVSYCIATEGQGAARCNTVGHRGFKALEIAAGGHATVTESAPIGAELNWVACKVDRDSVSTLIDNGTRGECLVSEGPTAIATK